MVDNIDAGRRRFLQGAGISGTALLAGCTEQLGLDGSQEDSGPNGIGIVASIDQQELQEIQATIQEEVREDVQEDVESGDVAEDEAQEEIQQRFQEREGEIIEFLEEEIETMTSEIEAESSIEIIETFPRNGAVRADGDAGELIGALELDPVQQLVSASDLQVPESGGNGDETDGE